MAKQRRSRAEKAPDAVTRAARVARERGAAERSSVKQRGSGRSMDVFGGEIRRRDVFPLLVLHSIAREPGYGNRLIDEIEAMTEGMISVNPNTIYPLLRDLEARGMIEGRWEHPDRRTRRYYSITAAGRKEYKRLHAEVQPFLDSAIRSIGLIKAEIYGDNGDG
jgi:PadR family transcriptional regulator, regulatory protein PadR